MRFPGDAPTSTLRLLRLIPLREGRRVLSARFLWSIWLASLRDAGSQNVRTHTRPNKSTRDARSRPETQALISFGRFAATRARVQFGFVPQKGDGASATRRRDTKVRSLDYPRREQVRQCLVDHRVHRSGGRMRWMFVTIVAGMLVAASAVAAQTTSAPPAASPAAPSTAPSAPATGAPALAPIPGTPSPAGVTQMPSPSINSTPSQSNVDLYPPTRVLPNPAPGAAPPNAASPGQIPPGGATQGRAPPTAQQRGGVNDRNPVGSDTDECVKLWGPQSPVSKQDWARACERNQAGLKKPE